MNSSRTPAATKMVAAKAMPVLVGRVAQTMRMTREAMRAMQKPKRRAEKRNLWERRRLSWKIVMWVVAARMKRRRREEEMGMSRGGVGVRPS